MLIDPWKQEAPSRHLPEFAYGEFQTDWNPWGIHCSACGGPDSLCLGCEQQVEAERGYAEA